ncbi:MAG: PEP-CTERM sorting domain-containing protein [Planctomycetia bacterium]|nr:PEP-CTERM sorting domain-containing protein [Planctomycetia bacterium]
MTTSRVSYLSTIHRSAAAHRTRGFSSSLFARVAFTLTLLGIGAAANVGHATLLYTLNFRITAEANGNAPVNILIGNVGYRQNHNALLLVAKPTIPTGGYVALLEPGTTDVADYLGVVFQPLAPEPFKHEWWLGDHPLPAFLPNLLGTVEETGNLQSLGHFFGLSDDAVQLQRFIEAAPVPEPATFVLSAIGALGLLGYAWRRRSRTATPPA